MTTLSLVCLLLAFQADEADQTLSTVPAASARTREYSPGQLLADELTLPRDAALSGKHLSLQEALSAATERAAREEIIRAYWALSAAIVEYHLRHDESLQLQQLAESLPAESPGTGSAARRSVEAALAAARAGFHEAALQVTAAQELLSARMGREAATPPLPYDLPHAGGYNTQAPRRGAPARLQLLYRTLPLRRKALDARCEAVYAALDALHAALDIHDQSSAPELVLPRIARLREQRQAFNASVRQYNEEIAEYALSLNNPASASQLVPMLIKAKAPPPAGTPTPAAMPSDERQPPRLPPGTNSRGRTDRSALVPPRKLDPGWTPAGQVVPAAGAASDSESNPVVPAAGAPRSPQPNGALPEPQQFRYKPDDRGGAARGSPASSLSADASTASASPWQQGLADIWQAPATQRTALLSRRLKLDFPPPESAPEDLAAEYLSLADCLRAASTAEQKAIVQAYARAAQAAATYGHLRDLIIRLEALLPLAVQFRRRAAGAAEMLDLQAVLHSTRAELQDAALNLLAARFALTAAVGLPLWGAWVWPATSPDEDIAAVRRTLPAPQEARLAPFNEILGARTEAVLQSDAAAQQLWNDYLHERRGLASLLDAAQERQAHTLAFLDSLQRCHTAACEMAPLEFPSRSPDSGDRSTRRGGAGSR